MGKVLLVTSTRRRAPWTISSPFAATRTIGISERLDRRAERPHQHLVETGAHTKPGGSSSTRLRSFCVNRCLVVYTQEHPLHGSYTVTGLHIQSFRDVTVRIRHSGLRVLLHFGVGSGPGQRRRLAPARDNACVHLHDSLLTMRLPIRVRAVCGWCGALVAQELCELAV